MGPELGARHVHHPPAKRPTSTSAQSLLVAFTRGGLLHGLAVLHESGRQPSKTPGAALSLDGTIRFSSPTQVSTPRTKSGFFVVHHIAAGAHETRQMVPGGDLGFERVSRNYCRNSIFTLKKNSGCPKRESNPHGVHHHRILSPAPHRISICFYNELYRHFSHMCNPVCKFHRLHMLSFTSRNCAPLVQRGWGNPPACGRELVPPPVVSKRNFPAGSAPQCTSSFDR